MTILCIVIFILIIIILLLVLILYQFSKKGTYLSDKEKEFLIFIIQIFEQYSDELGIQTKEQHKKLCDELEKIKNKHLKI